MHRRDFLRTTGWTGFLAASLPAAAASEDAPAPEAAPGPPLAFTSAPSVQYAGPDAVAVAIGVNAPSTAWIEYGETAALGRTEHGARDGLRPVDAVVHRFRLTGLRPGQEVHYRIHACPIDFRHAYDIRRGAARPTERFRFRWLDPASAEARFVVWNDTHEQDATLAALMARTPALRPDWLVYNGDMTNDLYHVERLAGQYLSPGGQPFSREWPLVFVRGNHEARGPAARALTRFIERPGGRFSYSFRHGPLGVLVLDTGEDKPDTHPVYAGLGDFVAYHREQTAWLEREIQQPHLREAPFRVAFAHIPLWWDTLRYAAEPEDPRSAWHALLAAGRFQALISGHTHRHGLFPPTSERPYAQVIGGGPRPDAATLIQGEATRETLRLTIQDLAGAELAAWQVAASG